MPLLFALSSVLLAAVPVTPAAPASAVSSVWDLMIKGGWIMLPIGACSLVAMTIIVERFIVTRRARVAPPALIDAASTLRHDPQRLLDRCAADGSPLAAVFTTALKARHEPRATRDQLIEQAGQRQVLRLRQRVRLLSSLPQTATMLGLLGTVLGMIRTFTVIAASGEALGKTERLAAGIYQAWTATAAGLAVAIPTLIFYHMILARIDTAAAALDKAATDWLEAESPRPAPAADITVESRVAPHPSPSANGVAVAAA